MIVGITLLVLFAASIHVRRFVNGVAMLIICSVVWLCMFIAMPLESPSRLWRVAGLGALVAAILIGWSAAELAFHIIRRLP